MPNFPPVLMTPEALVDRWQGAVTIETLANWRSQGKGPKFVVIGRAPRYRVADVLKYEANEARKARPKRD